MKETIEVTTTTTTTTTEKKEKSVLVLIFRIIVGLVFMFSGAVKAIDPLGSCYKFTDYFTLAFDMPQLSALSLPLAFILAALEFSVGFMLFFNMKGRLGAWLALGFMLIFTPLTLYIALKNPVHDCGCFGDAVLLTNWATFWKNIILIAMVIYLVIKRKQIDNPLDDRAELGIAIAVFLLGIVFQHMMYRHLPLMDFRPYKVGVNIPAEIEKGKNQKQRAEQIFVTYENSITHELREYEPDACPWDDSTWVSTWVWKETRSVPIYNNFWDRAKSWILDEPETIHNFTMTDTSGRDVTDIVLNIDKPVLMVISHKIEQSTIDGLNMLKELQSYAEKKDYLILCLTATNWEDIDIIKNEFGLQFPFFHTDDIVLKTVVRANPGIVKLEKGVITGKWNYRDFKFDKNY